MLRGFRNAVLAIGLIAISSAVLGQTDEQPQEPQRETQQEQGPTQIAPIPLPIEIVEDEAESEARERHEAETRQREIEDLVAQQGMNEAAQAMNRATQRMADYSWWATLFVGGGTVLVFASLILMWGANRAAVAAIKVTREMGQLQIRAYMATDVNNIGWVRDANNANIYGVNVQWKNSGDTPARRCHGRASARVFDDVMPGDFDYPDLLIPGVTETKHVGPGQTLWFRVGGIVGRDVIAAERGEKHIYVWSWVEYDDIFGAHRRRTELCFKLHTSQRGATCFASISGPFNGADEDSHHQTKT